MSVGRWSIVVVWLVACGPAIPALPSKGGPEWFEVKSEHFTLWTDASVDRGREMVRELERRRQVITTAMNAASTATAFVFAPRDAREFGAFVTSDAIGVAWPPDNPSGQPGIILAANERDRDHVVDHELAHVISFGIVKNQPSWLAEGIATYFEMVDIFSDDTSVQIGAPRSDRLRFLRGYHPLEVPDLFTSCDGKGCPPDTFYATAWALVSFLLNEHYDSFARYLQRLHQLPPTGPVKAWHDTTATMSPEERARYRESTRAQWREQQSAAWRDAFPDLPLDKLDRDLREWLVTGKLRLPHIKLTVKDYPVTTRGLGDAEVLAGRSFVRLMFTNDIAATRSDAEAAVALDRTNVLAHLVEATLTHTIAPDDARATAAAHPDDWRALRLVELAFHGRPEGDEAHDRLCSMAADMASECAVANRRGAGTGGAQPYGRASDSD